MAQHLSYKLGFSGISGAMFGLKSRADGTAGHEHGFAEGRRYVLQTMVMFFYVGRLGGDVRVSYR
jgi:hypothetical protein